MEYSTMKNSAAVAPLSMPIDWAIGAIQFSTDPLKKRNRSIISTRNSMNRTTQELHDRIAQLEGAVIDRERRILGLASIIRSQDKNQVVTTRLTEDEAKMLGITNWSAATECRNVPG